MKMHFIPYGRQNISAQDIESVKEVLLSDWLTQGPAVKRFEATIKNYCGSQYAIAVCNATAALHISCLALGVGSGDIVWTSPNTFLSSANCARFCGAEVDFVDICPITYNMSIDALEEKLIFAKKINKLPKVVIPVHFAGQSCDMQSVWRLSHEYGFRVIEDAAHAIGGKYMEQPIGNCEYSDIAIFSFHPVKIITTGEGGALVTNDSKLAEKIALLSSHGVTGDKRLMQESAEGGWYYEQLDLGFNYRITDLQCALGISQFLRLDQFVQQRHQHYQYYNGLLKDLPVTLPSQSRCSYSALHLYPIQVEKMIRKSVFDFLRENKIGVNVHYIPVYLQPYYKRLGFKQGYCPNAEEYYQKAISLPMFYDLVENEQAYVVEKLKEALLS
ncbi:UDP-4-amino-4,6-dideoxy-N-acetyl-beta-L-altrosamine transaminase [Piscirickettsia salmonis]|nr:UDP-4-amino-4,6-dideoxy-N-acetyl-beta-L-altrosamine transaminase [Piscirickettsia salmonis]